MSNFQLVHSDLTGNTLTNEVDFEDEYDMLKRHSISDYMHDKSRYYEYEKFDDISTVVLPADNYVEASQPSKKEKVKTYFNNFFNNGLWSSYKRNKSNVSNATEPEMLVDEVTLNDEKMDYDDDNDFNNDYMMEDANAESVEVLSVNPRKVFSTVDDIALSQHHVVNFHSIINQNDDNQFYLQSNNNPYELSEVGRVHYTMDFEEEPEDDGEDDDYDDEKEDSSEDETQSRSNSKFVNSTTAKAANNDQQRFKKGVSTTVKVTGLPQKTRGRKPSLVPDFSKQFGCEFCDRRFKRQEHLKRHVRSLHMGEKPFECHICNKKFSRSDNLNQHIKTHTH